VTDVPARAPYGRRSSPVLGALPAQEQAPTTYYGLPAVKPSHYRLLISTYFFVGGLAGASQLIAQMVDLTGGLKDRPLVRAGRYIALLGALLSPVLLIKDLHTPSRWYNMLRIFRPTSPMSIGSWTLAGFGTCSGLAAFGQVLEDLGFVGAGRWFGRFFGMPAAGLGMLMSVYTGVLLSATSTPLWAVAYRHLPPLFGATSMASATSLLSVALPLFGGQAPRTERRLQWLAAISGAAQLLLARRAEHAWTQAGVTPPGEHPKFGPVYRIGALGLGVLWPLAVHVLLIPLGKRPRTLVMTASIASLLGAFVERTVLVMAGKDSASRPEEYFRITGAQPNGVVQQDG
jgi:formate-dependent nitrite reductase membrane component NrfD